MTVIRRIINTRNAPVFKAAPYNQAVGVNNMLFVSGVLGMDKDTLKLVDGGAAAEARQALCNLGEILKASGSSYENVIKNTLFISDINDSEAINCVYKEFFCKDYPARSSFQVVKIAMDARLEMESIAIIGKVKTVKRCV